MRIYRELVKSTNQYRLEDLELGTGEGVKQIVKVCFIVDNG